MKNNFIAFLFVGASADLARVMVGQLFSSCGEQVKMQKTGCPLPKHKKKQTLPKQKQNTPQKQRRHPELRETVKLRFQNSKDPRSTQNK